MKSLPTLELYDVCICGSGLAGLCLARQLKMEIPDLKVVLLDRDKRPLKSGTHKVGESSIEAGTHYLTHTLKLGEYLENVHKFKCGLRFYTKDGNLPIDQRTESGALDFPAIPAMQLDRGILENDLRQMCIDMGITLLDGVAVKDINLSDNDSHEVIVSDPRNDIVSLRTRWVIDAMGRRRFLAKKLGIREEVNHKASACWWRLPGKWNVTNAVDKPTSESDWGERELAPRWYSTNHFMGYGYWVWVIPVASHTSLGIVVDENIHPIKEISSYEKAFKWLEKHEPHIADWTRNIEPDDFLALKNFSHTSKYFYSHNKWALVGEAALFGDPYYSTGTDLIALQNNIITRMIKREINGQLTEKIVNDYNTLVAEFFRGVLAMYEGQYTLFGNEYVHYQKTMWDYDYITGAMGKLGFSPHILDEVEELANINAMLKKWSDLNIRVQKLARDWSALNPNKSINRTDTSDNDIGPKGMLVPNIQVFQTFNDQLKMRDAKGLVNACTENLLKFAEGRAIWMFKKAVKDLKMLSNVPETLAEKVENSNWLNANAIDLDYKTWEANGLFNVTGTYRIDKAQMDYMVPAAPEAESMIANYPRPHELIWQQILNNPDQIAVLRGDTKISYRKLGEMVSSVAYNLTEKLRLERGSVVVAIHDPSTELEALATIIGTLTAEMKFIGLPNNNSVTRFVDSMSPSLTVVHKNDAIHTHSNTILYSELTDPNTTTYTSTENPSFESRITNCYAQLRGDAGSQSLHWITHYSLMNLFLYTELALRRSMALNIDDAVHPKLVVHSTTPIGYDWMLPLIYGGILVFDNFSKSNKDIFNNLESAADSQNGQPVISGIPETLLKMTGGVPRNEKFMLLSVDKALTSDQSSMLTKTIPIVVNSGIITWGHEELWKEKASQPLKIETAVT